MQVPPEPRVSFVIGGVQKAGTSALAKYLSTHPGLRLPMHKEAHVFDAPDFDEAWTQREIDARYAGQFDAGNPVALHGDATPFYLFQPRVVARIARYNPAMRWIVLLRDPIERALSHYHMERQRGNERCPFWAALMLERWRLHGHEDDFARISPLRRHSYRARGDYARQLDSLYAHFPREQVLLLRSDELADEPIAVLRRVHAFLGLPVIDRHAGLEPVFVGEYSRWKGDSWSRRILCWWWRRELDAQARHGLLWERT